MTEGAQHIGVTIAGKYRINRLIGVGGMGSVYEGQHLDLAKRVAVKIIDGAADTSTELATRFKREARAASAVESENIVQVFDVGRDPEVGLYMVMELLHGEDLEMRLRKQPGRRLDPVIVAQIGHQVARALVKAHGARVIHRDLKPANIFLTDRDDGSMRVKILDFGISKLLASEASITTNKEGLLQLTAAGVALGTPQYMSPEQAQGLTTVDRRSDVWGLGVVLYEALAGIPAYAELGSYQETIMKILTDRPQPLSKVAPWVPEAFAKVIHAAIEHDVTVRIQDCAIFAARIAEALPEAVMGSTGPFQAVEKLARLGSSHSHAAYVPPAPAPAAAAPAAAAPAAAPRPSARPARPISLGDDTQVVVRPSDPGAPAEEGSLSATMLADSSRQTSRDPPKVAIFDSSKPAEAPEEPAPMSTGDPTMFQSPAWVEAPNQGPTTMKSGLAMGGTTTERPAAKPLHALYAAGLTALAVIVVGGALIMLVGRGQGGATDSVGAASGLPTSTPLEPTAPVAAPPGAVTGAAPVAPATGVANVAEAPPMAGADASATTAAADAP